MRDDRITPWYYLAAGFRIGLRLVLVPLFAYLLILAMSHFVDAVLATLDNELSRAGWLR